MIGYCVQPMPGLASYRLRVEIPSKHLGVPYVIGKPGNPSFFYKDGDCKLAVSLFVPVVYDVVNDHFASKREYREMCSVADRITCASDVMADVVWKHTGIEATVIDDPYENAELEPLCYGNGVAWFGHSANISSIRPYTEIPGLVVCSNVAGAVPWSPVNELLTLSGCAVVLVTGNNPGASSNRIVKALRAGRFVVTPGGVESWDRFKDFIWVGNVREGIAWALNNREEACNKIKAGQEWVRSRYSPEVIGSQWKALFAST
jgi:hypothetical protein